MLDFLMQLICMCHTPGVVSFVLVLLKTLLDKCAPTLAAWLLICLTFFVKYSSLFYRLNPY